MTLRAFVLLFSSLCPSLAATEEELTQATYRELVARYQNGSYQTAAETLTRFPLNDVHVRNEELPRVLDLERPDEVRELRAAMLLNAEAALLSVLPPTRSDFYLEEAVLLSTSLPRVEGIRMQKRFHLAAAYQLYSERRVVDALRVFQPAVERYPADLELQFAFGQLSEVSGWLNSSTEDLESAKASYRAVLQLHQDAKTMVRLARVLTLLGEPREAIPLLTDALAAELEPSHGVVALLTLGDALRQSDRLSEAIETYRRARRLDPSCQAAHVLLAFSLHQSGRMEEARTVLIESLAAGDRAGVARDAFQRYLMGESQLHIPMWESLRQSVQ